MVSGGFRRELSNEVEVKERSFFQHFDRKQKETARGTVFFVYTYAYLPFERCFFMTIRLATGFEFARFIRSSSCSRSHFS